MVMDIWKLRHSFAWLEAKGISSFLTCHITKGVMIFASGIPIHPRKDDKWANMAQVRSCFGISDVVMVIRSLLGVTIRQPSEARWTGSIETVLLGSPDFIGVLLACIYLLLLMTSTKVGGYAAEE